MPIPKIRAWNGCRDGYAAKNFHTGVRSFLFPWFRLEPEYSFDRYSVNADDSWNPGRLEYLSTQKPFPVVASCAKKSIVRIESNAST